MGQQQVKICDYTWRDSAGSESCDKKRFVCLFCTNCHKLKCQHFVFLLHVLNTWIKKREREATNALIRQKCLLVGFLIIYCQLILFFY